jgi:hypothetical protein
MCDKCADLDKLIGHLRRMIEHLVAPQLVAAVKEMIEEMEAQKAQLHAKPDKIINKNWRVT